MLSSEVTVPFSAVSRGTGRLSDRATDPARATKAVAQTGAVPLILFSNGPLLSL